MSGKYFIQDHPLATEHHAFLRLGLPGWTGCYLQELDGWLAVYEASEARLLAGKAST